jgi:hypothetical protein
LRKYPALGAIATIKNWRTENSEKLTVLRAEKEVFRICILTFGGEISNEL